MNNVDLADVALSLTQLAHRLNQFRRLTLTAQDRLRVLVVDRRPMARQAIRHALADEHEVFEAEGFAAALVAMATGIFDAIVTDEELDGAGSGMALLAEVQNRWPCVRRVMCTVDLSSLAASLNIGIVHRVLERPIVDGMLLASLR